ncbi:uncharacterized protein LOC113462015 [Phoenix dactylifera]|uniref:Uncharacterized protein LOC113462015 n=1 Tax=Phoenix dactylifera TaxID=42345 RepID=A0A8B9AN53_PHODC|nr:uncharacterized protein LOC113462015 [Phoenix dactylifera]
MEAIMQSPSTCTSIRESPIRRVLRQKLSLREVSMAQRKEKSNLRGDAPSSGDKILQGSAKETPSKHEPSHLPLPKVELVDKMLKLDMKSNDKGKSSTTTKELHIVDLSDGTKWIIDDKIVVDLLKKYKSAPDQKTKDEIVKLLESRVASLSTKVKAGQSHKICQVSKDTAGAGLDGNRLDSDKPTHGGLPAKNQKYQESKIIKDLQNLKLDNDNKASKKKEVDRSKKK